MQIGAAQMAVVPTELDPQIGMHHRAALEANGAEHTLIVGLGNDHLGYQVPFDKWNPSCFACAPYILAGVPELCPALPSDCSTVFENNVGQLVDPQVSKALYDAIDLLP